MFCCFDERLIVSGTSFHQMLHEKIIHSRTIEDLESFSIGLTAVGINQSKSRKILKIPKVIRLNFEMTGC